MGVRRRARRSGSRSVSRSIAAAVCAALIATACDSQVPSGAPTTPTAPAPTEAAIAVIEVTPAAILLDEAGQTKALAATARAADGTPIPTTVTWSSSDPGVAAVDASGTVTAASAVGSAAITATVGEVASEPVIVTVATPVDGAVLVTDAQFVEGPSAVDPAAEPAADNAYEVVVSGVTGLQAGSIVINTEALPVAGEVVSATPEGANTRVRIVVVPPGELFDEVEFSDTVDLSEGPFEIPAELAAAYDVVQDGSSFTFTPKAGAASAGGATLARWNAPAAPPAVRGLGVPQGTVALPPLPPFGDCTAEAAFGSGLPVPLRLSAPPAFSVNATGTATRELTAAGTRISLAATPTLTIEAGLEIKAAFEAKVGCKVTLVTRKFRVPGWAGLFFGGDVEFGLGAELSGKVTLVNAKVGGKLEVKPTISASLDCPTGGECSLDGSVTSENKLEPVLEAPSLNQVKFEPALTFFGFVSLEAGNADIDALQFKAIEAKAGVELGASLTLEGLQIDDAGENGRSKYDVKFKGEVGPAVKLGEFLEYLGLESVELLKLGFEVPLGSSPSGTAKADRSRYLPGDTGTVTVALAPDSTMLFGLYNVDRVVVARRDGLTTEALGSVDASKGQTTFEVPITASGLVDADELFAFVVTSLLPLDPPKLELGPASWSCDVDEPLTIDSLNDDPDKIYVVFDGESDCRLVAETGDGHFPAGAGAPDVILSIDTDPRQRAWDGEDSDDEDDGQSWEMVAGSAQDIPSGRHTFRSRRVDSGTVYVIRVTVQVDLLGGDNTRMTVSEVSITLAP
jgi:hypothetical protein